MVGISFDFISFWLSSALWLRESEGHASLTIKSYVNQRRILIYSIFKGTMLTVKISFVQCIAVTCSSMSWAAGGDFIKLQVEGAIKPTDPFWMSFTNAICARPCVHATASSDCHKKDSSCPDLHNHLPSIHHSLCIVRPTNNLPPKVCSILSSMMSCSTSVYLGGI